MYEEYKPDIDKMKKMVESLQAFHGQTHGLDTNYQTQMQNFNNAIQSLFAVSGMFTGSAANTLQDITSKYGQTEQSFAGNYGDTSPQLSSATSYCQSTARNIQDILDEFDKDMLNYNNKLIDMINENVFQREATIISNNIFHGPYANVELMDVQAYADGQCVYPPETPHITQRMQWEQWQWERNMDSLAADPLPSLPAAPTDPAPYKADPDSIFYPPANLLTQEQKALTVQSIIADLSREGVYFNQSEIENLVSQGYDPETIKNIFRNGVYGVFNYPQGPDTSVTTAQLMDELLPADQLKFIQIVKQYQATHPNLTAGQVLNYLRYTKMKAQLDYLTGQITGTDPNDPISQEIVNAFPQRAADMMTRLNKKIGNSINRVTDPFTVLDKQLDGWQPHITGIWGEWGAIKRYYQQGQLLDYSVDLQPRGSGEVDIKINENNVTKWVEVKNVTSPSNVWSTALKQVKNYISIDHAKSIIIELPQQDPNDSNNWVSSQQLKNLEDIEKQNPDVHFEIRGKQNPPLPFEPPIRYWGNVLP